MDHHSSDRILYVGGYAASDEPGIHILAFNSLIGRLRVVGSVAGIDNPSFLALRQPADMLYAVSETGTGAEVVALRVDPATASAAIRHRQKCSGAGPCHITVSPSGRHVLVASYQGGGVSVFPLSETGALGSENQFIPHGGPADAALETNEHDRTSHPHQVVFSPSGQHVCVPDLGLDRVYVYQWNESAGKMLFRRAHRLCDGAGPRHMVFHPHKPYVYTINELDSTVSVFEHAQNDDGAWRHLQTVTTLPADFAGESFSADIHMDRAGQFLYASNRGHDSIAVFAVDQGTGRVSMPQHASTGGRTPRNFNLEIADNFVIVANQDTSTLRVFARDAATGMLSRAAHETTVPRPTCIVG